MPQLKEILQATFASRSFEKFFSGVSFQFSETAPVTIKITSCKQITRSKGYRLTAYSVQTKAESSNGITAYGFGEDDFELLAIQKGIAEAIERCVFKIVKAHGVKISNTSGWAAHITKEKSQNSALNELLERDASLLHWLSQTPMKKLEAETLPSNLKAWAKNELSLAPRFNQLKILVTHLGFAPVTVAVIQNETGHGFISQASAKSISTSIEKSLAEVCRIADLSEKGLLKTDSPEIPKTPDDHAVYYATREKIPSWIFGESMNWSEANKLWKDKIKKLNDEKPVVQFETFKCGSLFISQAKSEQVQALYFGPTEQALQQGLINTLRIKKVCGVEILFLQPHFVP